MTPEGFGTSIVKAESTKIYFNQQNYNRLLLLYKLLTTGHPATSILSISFWILTSVNYRENIYQINSDSKLHSYVRHGVPYLIHLIIFYLKSKIKLKMKPFFQRLILITAQQWHTDEHTIFIHFDYIIENIRV